MLHTIMTSQDMLIYLFFNHIEACTLYDRVQHNIALTYHGLIWYRITNQNS